MINKWVFFPAGGRGYDDCAILWKSALSLTVETVVVANNRVSSILINIHVHGTRFMLYCVYMSYDTRYYRVNIRI